MATKRKVAVRYTTRACDFCKGRHLRCDGQDICFQCKRRNQTCNYTQKTVKRGPKPKKKSKKEHGGGEEGPSSGEEGPLWKGVDVKYEDFGNGRGPVHGGGAVEFSTVSGVEPTLDLVMGTLVAFHERVNPVYPINFTVYPQIGLEVWKQVTANYQYSKVNDMVEAFTYCVILGHGARVTGHESLSAEFSSKAEILSHSLFIAPNHLNPEIFASHADNLVATSTLLGVLKMESTDFNTARLCFIQAYNVLNMHINEISPKVAHRLYAHLAGMSRSTSDMSHWVSNARDLGLEANTPINRVMLALLYSSPSLLRDPKNKTLPTSLHLDSNPRQEDQLLYQKMIQELNDTDSAIPWEGGDPKDPTCSTDYLTSYHIILDGCRAIVYAQLGDRAKSTEHANKCIENCKLLQKVMYWPIPVALAYAVQVAKAANEAVMFNEGLTILSSYTEHYPFVFSMISHIKGGPYDGLMDIPGLITGSASSMAGVSLPPMACIPGGLPGGIPGVSNASIAGSVPMQGIMTGVPMPGIPGVPMQGMDLQMMLGMGGIPMGAIPMPMPPLGMGNMGMMNPAAATAAGVAMVGGLPLDVLFPPNHLGYNLIPPITNMNSIITGTPTAPPTSTSAPVPRGNGLPPNVNNLPTPVMVTPVPVPPGPHDPPLPLSLHQDKKSPLSPSPSLLNSTPITTASLLHPPIITASLLNPSSSTPIPLILDGTDLNTPKPLDNSPSSCRPNDHEHSAPPSSSSSSSSSSSTSSSSSVPNVSSLLSSGGMYPDNPNEGSNPTSVAYFSMDNHVLI